MEKEKRLIFMPYYPEWERTLALFPSDDAIAIIHAACEYAVYGIEPNMERDKMIAFEHMRSNIDECIARYENRKNQGRRAANARWHDGYNADIPTSGTMQEHADACGSMQNMQEHADACGSMLTHADDANITRNINTNKRETNTNNTAQEPVSVDTSNNDDIALPMWGGRDWIMSDDMREELRAQYPAIDIDNALRNMQRWLSDNPQVRYGADKMSKFVRDWLERSKNTPTGSRPQKKNAFNSFESHSYTDEQMAEIENALLYQSSNDEVVNSDEYCE